MPSAQWILSLADTQSSAVFSSHTSRIFPDPTLDVLAAILSSIRFAAECDGGSLVFTEPTMGALCPGSADRRVKQYYLNGILSKRQ